MKAALKLGPAPLIAPEAPILDQFRARGLVLQAHESNSIGPRLLAGLDRRDFVGESLEQQLAILVALLP